MSKLNTGSASTKGVLLKANIAFSVIISENIMPAIVANARDIDLLGSFGICLFSSIKNFFSPFFINAVVIYDSKYIIAKLIANTYILCFRLVLNIPTYLSPIPSICKYSPLMFI